MRVQVVEDNPTLRAVACLEVELADDLELVGEAGDGMEALQVARAQRPDAILLDVDIPGMNGLEALPHLVRIVPNARIVVYTSDDSPRSRMEAERHGACAYVLKGDAPIRVALDHLRVHHDDNPARTAPE